MIKLIIPFFTLVVVTSCSSEPTKNNKVVDAQVVTSEVAKNNQEGSVKKINQEVKVVETIEELTPIVEGSKTTEVLVRKEEIKVVKEVDKKNATLPPIIEKEVAAVKEEIKEVTAPVIETTVSHSIWNTLLKQNVSTSGKVNYKGFKSNQVKLEEYIALLKSKSPTNDWSKNEKLAYWINVYNVFTVKLIVDNYPLKSITDLNKPWDQKIINIDGQNYSLGDVENNILRKMHESRIHFAINCASVSCPKLLNEAFVADKLNSQLRKVTKSFFNDATKNDLSANPIKISKLFEWYNGDFSRGDVLTYINKYSGKTIPTETKIEYLEYNWNLNE